MHPSLHLAWLILAVGCVPGSPAQQASDPERPWRQRGDVIDSILPMEEYVARFRVGTRQVTQLAHGAPSREALTRRVLEATAAADTAALVSLLVTRGEFAWLVFPDHLYRDAPYELDPAILWLQMGAESEKGLTRLLKRHGGRPLTLRSVGCQRDTLVLVRGSATLQRDCVISYTDGDSTLSRRLFGSIYERDGQFKLMGYGNDL
jgi:hypothetical protein